MKIQLPAFCTASSFQSILAQVFDESAKPRTNAYIFDFGSIQKVDYWSWIGLVNLCLWLKKQHINVSATTRGIHKDEAAFPFSPGAAAQFLAADEYGQHLAAKRIASAQVDAWVQEMLMPWFVKEVRAGQLLNSINPFKSLCSYMSVFNRELLLGASFHSKEDISLWVAGIGLELPAIGRQVLATSVSDLIALAFLTEGGGSVFGSGNRKAHLGALLHEHVAHFWGEVKILSGFTDFTYVYSEAGLHKKIGLSHAYCPGFIAELRLPVARAFSMLNEPQGQSRAVSAL